MGRTSEDCTVGFFKFTAAMSAEVNSVSLIMGHSGRLSPSLDRVLSLIIFLLSYDSFMGILPDIPFLFRNTTLILVADKSTLPCMVDHRAGVLDILNHS